MIGYYNKKENETQLVLFVNEKRILNYYRNVGFLRLCVFNMTILFKNTNIYEMLYSEINGYDKYFKLGNWITRIIKK